MAIISRSRLTTLTESKFGQRTFSEAVNESKQESRTYATTSIFLSHSHNDLDKKPVNEVIVLLRKSGVRVYIDSLDSNMPPFTNAETARKIKDAIKINKKFIFLATNNAINSKWCNWELGFGDAYKYMDHIALFPISEASGTWEGNEYLRIYPRIEETASSETFKVIFPNGTEKSLADWLRFQ